MAEDPIEELPPYPLEPLEDIIKDVKEELELEEEIHKLEEKDSPELPEPE